MLIIVVISIVCCYKFKKHEQKSIFFFLPACFRYDDPALLSPASQTCDAGDDARDQICLHDNNLNIIYHKESSAMSLNVSIYRSGIWFDYRKDSS